MYIALKEIERERVNVMIPEKNRIVQNEKV